MGGGRESIVERERKRKDERERERDCGEEMKKLMFYVRVTFLR